MPDDERQSIILQIAMLDKMLKCKHAFPPDSNICRLCGWVYRVYPIKRNPGDGQP